MRSHASIPLLVAVAAVWLAGCESKTSAVAPTVAPTTLERKDLVVGKGEEAKNGYTAFVHYKGWLNNGEVFDKNEDKDEPFSFTLGKGDVIKGWDQGVAGMRVGGKRNLVIPSDLGYGPNGAGKIPGGATLHFDIELVKITKPEDLETITVKINKQGAGPECKQGDKVVVTYVAKDASGAILDSSEDHGGKVAFVIGKRQLASEGLESAIVGMKKGEEREISLPPQYALHLPMPGTMGKQSVTVTLVEIK